jgi:hypothetical protein
MIRRLLTWLFSRRYRAHHARRVADGWQLTDLE